jgi:hypothetical protein
MTWGARVVKADGSVNGNSACDDCRHHQTDAIGRRPCRIPSLVSVVGWMLSAIDVANNGHVVSGQVELRCNGFEDK